MKKMSKNNNLIFLILLTILFDISLTQKLAKESLGGWGEKIISDKTEEYEKISEAYEKYLISEGYSHEETDFLPFGLFKQTSNGVNYRVLLAVKKKSSDSATIFDILMHKSNNEIKVISSKNPDYTSTNISEKMKKKIKDAIAKFYFKELYIASNFEIQYEYHKLSGLNDYAIYDIVAHLSNKEGNIDKRLLVVYRNDKTFTVEQELKENK